MRKTKRQIRKEQAELEAFRFNVQLRYVCGLAKIGGKEHYIDVEASLIFG